MEPRNLHHSFPQLTLHVIAVIPIGTSQRPPGCRGAAGTESYHHGIRDNSVVAGIPQFTHQPALLSLRFSNIKEAPGQTRSRFIFGGDVWSQDISGGERHKQSTSPLFSFPAPSFNKGYRSPSWQLSCRPPRYLRESKYSSILMVPRDISREWLTRSL